MPSDHERMLEAKLHYTFRHPALLRQALVHPSSGFTPDNQRLEFAGDALFGAALTLLIYQAKPDWPEGAMTKLRHVLVSTDSLCDWADSLALKLQSPVQANSKKNKTTFRKPMADAVEALLAAVYWDAQQAGENGFAAVCHLVNQRFADIVHQASPDAWEQHDAKTTLQERAASLSLPAPIYTLEGKKGPDHAPLFTVSVKVDTVVAKASAPSLKKAQTEAARIALTLLPVSSKS